MERWQHLREERLYDLKTDAARVAVEERRDDLLGENDGYLGPEDHELHGDYYRRRWFH